jgi:excisionase family DNA binding protein
MHVELDVMSPTLEELRDWIPGHEVARVLGVSRNTALKLLKEGHIRAVRTKLGWLADPQSVEEYRKTRRS